MMHGWPWVWLATACVKPPLLDDACASGRVCAIAGTGELGFNGDALPATQTRLASPSAAYESPDGSIVIVDYSNMRVRRIGTDGTIETVVGNGFHAYSEEGASPMETPLENPIDVAWRPDGDLCVQPQHEGRIVCVDDGTRINRFAGTGVIADSGDDGAAIDAEMGYGGGMAFAEEGALYISDSTFSRIRRVDPNGTIRTVLGTGTAGLGGDGPGDGMALRFPGRLAVDRALQRLYVADTFNHRVVALDTATGAARVIAGTGDAGRDGDGGPARDARLNLPNGVVAAPSGGVLIADQRNPVIRHVDASGTIRTVVGTGESVSTNATDLTPLETQLLGPAGLSWTADGDLLIAEQFGHRIWVARQLWDEL